MTQQIFPASSVSGAITLPGDKSISHRYAMLAGIAEGTTKISAYSTGADCQSTLGCMRALGATVERTNGVVSIEGHGLDGLREPAAALDAGNSGSTIRMLSGILAAQPFATTIGGDESLSRRPMARIMTPLAQMGARIDARDQKFPPLTIHGAPLHSMDYTLPVASVLAKVHRDRLLVELDAVYPGYGLARHKGYGTREHQQALRRLGACREHRALFLRKLQGAGETGAQSEMAW